jgi:hypothetical protein
MNLSWSRHGDSGNDPRDPDIFPPRESILRRSLLPDGRPLSPRGPQIVHLIGSRCTTGEAQAFRDEAFSETAALITTIVTGATALEELLTNRFAGWGPVQALTQGDMDAVTNVGAPEQVGASIFDSFGFARVSVGTDLLRRYAAEILASEAADRLAGSASAVCDSAQLLNFAQGDAENWAASISDRVIASIEHEAGENGLYAASGLTRNLIAEASASPEPEVRALGPNLLEPLLRALQHGLTQVESSPPGIPWPGAPNARALSVIEPNSFPEVFKDLLIATCGTDEIRSRQQAARAIAIGREVGLRLITVKRPMRPAGQIGGRRRSAAPIVVELHCRPADLLARADRWVTRIGTPIAMFLSHNLRSIVTASEDGMPGGTSIRSREDRLLTIVERAFQQAAPRVVLTHRLDLGMHPQGVGDSRYRIRWFGGSLPFVGHPLEGRLRELLNRQLPEPYENESRQLLTEFSPSASFDIVTSLSRPVDLMTISSLTHPIAAEWSASRRDSWSARRFAREGRARSLEESLPSADCTLARHDPWLVHRQSPRPHRPERRSHLYRARPAERSAKSRIPAQSPLQRAAYWTGRACRCTRVHHAREARGQPR